MVATGQLAREMETWLAPLEVTPLQSALARRLMKALLTAAAEADESLAADAVSESSDVLSVVRLLEQPGILAELSAADPLAPARLRGVAARHALLERAGGTLSTEEVAAALNLSRQAVDKRRRAGRLLALSFGRRGYRYPAFQFVDGDVLPGLERVLPELGDQDVWSRLAFFVNRRSDLGDKAPASLLKRHVVEPVVQAAHATGEHGAA
ncbi:MAG: hypothetical protein AB7I50_07430 [Vicinamibacterales bacterium]